MKCRTNPQPGLHGDVSMVLIDDGIGRGSLPFLKKMAENKFTQKN